MSALASEFSADEKIWIYCDKASKIEGRNWYKIVDAYMHQLYYGELVQKKLMHICINSKPCGYHLE
jgi:hypothetical protein